METTPDRSLARHKRIYRTLLLAYPRAFRQVYGADMVQVFGDRLRAERQSRRRAGFRVWFVTLLDVAKTAPVQRMERRMSREAGFAILFTMLLVVAVAAFAMGIGGLAINVALGALIITAIALGASGVLSRRNARNATPAGQLGLSDWWVVLAGIMGAVEIFFGVGQLIRDPKIGNLIALAVLSGFGLAVLAGTRLRSRSRSSGDWMIVVGVLPFIGVWWLIVPAVLAIVVMVMALIDSGNATRRQVA